MQPRYFTTPVSLATQAAVLYQSNLRGVVVFPEFLTESGRLALLEEAAGNAALFKRAKAKQGKVAQDFFEIYFGEAEDASLQPHFPRAMAFRRDYQSLVDELGERAGFGNGSTINSIGINHYPNGSSGISPHQDRISDVNVVSIVVLHGQAPLYACTGRTLEGALELCVPAGSLVLLRHHRNPAEAALRAWHAVGAVTQERYSMMLRQHAG